MNVNLLEKKRAIISQWHMNYLLNELRILFDDDFKIIAIRDNTAIRIYSQWHVLIVEFFYENGDAVVVKLGGNWSIFNMNILKSCILKTFHWDFVPENKCCCGIFAQKNQLRFLI